MTPPSHGSRLRALTCLGLSLALVAAAAAGCSSGGDGDKDADVSPPRTVTDAASTGATTSSAPVTTAPRTTTGPGPARQVAPAPTSAQVAAADAQARVKRLDTTHGSLTRLVAGSPATAGYSLWSVQTANGLANMILNASEDGIAWTACSREFAGVIDHCGTAAVPPSTVLVAGHVSPRVRSVDVILRSGARRAAVVGAGGWLFAEKGADISDPSAPQRPVAAEAYDATGKLLATAPLG